MAATCLTRVLAASLCFALAGCGPGPSHLSAGARMPDLELAGLDTDRIRLSSLAGRVVVLNFWATWCAACRAEMDSLQRLAGDAHAHGIAVLGVSVDDDANLVREHVRRNGWDFARFIDRGRALSRGALGVESLPRTYVVAPDGRIAMVVSGARDWASAEMIAALVALKAGAAR